MTIESNSVKDSGEKPYAEVVTFNRINYTGVIVELTPYIDLPPSQVTLVPSVMQDVLPMSVRTPKTSPIIKGNGMLLSVKEVQDNISGIKMTSELKPDQQAARGDAKKYKSRIVRKG